MHTWDPETKTESQGYRVLWEPQKGNSFLSIWTLDPKPQDIQWGQDIDSVGTKVTWQGQVTMEHSGRTCDCGLVVQLL